MDNWDKAARILGSDSGEFMMRMAFDIALNSANMDPAERLEIEHLRKLTIKEILSPELNQRARSLLIRVFEFAIDKAKQGIPPQFLTFWKQ